MRKMYARIPHSATTERPLKGCMLLVKEPTSMAERSAMETRVQGQRPTLYIVDSGADACLICWLFVGQL
jgi:hypothetical protein